MIGRILGALLLAPVLAACAVAGGAGPTTEEKQVDSVYPGARRYAFSNWAGPRLQVWFYRPAGAGADAPVVFVMHGVARDANRYLREWAPVAESHGVVLVVPEFSRTAFPGAGGYQLGNTSDQSGAPNPRVRWSYSAIEAVFDDVVDREGLSATRYYLYGHSAGGQFVHRFVMLGAGARLERAVAANSGWYTFPSNEIGWPYGLAGAPQAADASAMFSAPLHLVLGDRDNDPKHHSLSREPGAMAQGEHRFERGQRFYAAARAASAEQGVALQWSCSVAPGLAHDNALAARYAATILFGPAPEGVDVCRPLPSLVGP